jgi:PPOX class probable F420-dependent enzyme
MLEKARYISLRTYRRSGVTVDTPIWCAPVAGYLVAFSTGQAGKVKRLRNSDKAQIANCDARGKLLGDWIDARATITTENVSIKEALLALRKKYGWQMLLADWGAKLTGKFNKRAYICIKVQSEND